jgi:hypothetical protein
MIKLWMVVVFFLLWPFAYSLLRHKNARGILNPDLDLVLFLFACWGVVAGIIIAKVLF